MGLKFGVNIRGKGIIKVSKKLVLNMFCQMIGIKIIYLIKKYMRVRFLLRNLGHKTFVLFINKTKTNIRCSAVEHLERANFWNFCYYFVLKKKHI